MATPHYVIIGNGSAGNKAAAVLRDGDAESRISILSQEPTHYLFRHRLARLLREGGELSSVHVHSPGWYEKRNIRLRLNQSVIRVNPDEKWLLLAHREKIHYDKLLICSGATHRIPEYLSHFEDHLTRFSSGRDALLFQRRFDRISHVTLLGGDCIGLQLLTALLPAGKKVTMIMDAYRFWPMEFDDDIKERLASVLAEKGVDVISNDYVTGIDRLEHGFMIKTDWWGGDRNR